MEETDIAKYTIKDSVFTNLFQDKKYLIQLYRALHPEDTETTEDELKDITIKNILVDVCYNDLGFTVGDKIMILTEAQTTWTMNIIIRALMYLVQSYHEYFERRNDNLYGSKKVKLPKAELYVIFTGKRVSKPEYVSLSEELKIYGRTRVAITNTINICKDRDVLKEYLSSREKEVVDMVMTLFDEEQVMRAYVESEKEEAAMISAIEMCQEIGLPISETIKKVAGKYKLEENDAEVWVQRYWKIEGDSR